MEFKIGPVSLNWRGEGESDRGNNSKDKNWRKKWQAARRASTYWG